MIESQLLLLLEHWYYSIQNNTKKYELTYQYYNNILQWHNEAVEVFIYLRLNKPDGENKMIHLTKLSILIKQGGFFPNVNKGDSFGNTKLFDYQRYRNVILDFLVYSYQLFLRSDYTRYIKHTEQLKRLKISKTN